MPNKERKAERLFISTVETIEVRGGGGMGVVGGSIY